jgi:hypothetical protein
MSSPPQSKEIYNRQLWLKYLYSPVEILKYIFEKLGIFISKLADSSIPLLNIINQNPLMHYIAFAIALVVALAIIFGSVKKGKNKKEQKNPTLDMINPFNYIKIPNIIPRYRMNLFSYSVSPYGKKEHVSETDRPRLNGGRCDNLKNLDIGKDLCLKTTMPEPIVWTIDIDKMPDFRDNLSTQTKTTIDGNGQFYRVTIPWKIYNEDGIHYYPSCADAVFEDGTSASYLFTDRFNSCERKTVNRKTAFAEKKRQANGRLDEYLSS